MKIVYLRPEDLDLLIEVGKAPSQIKPDDALYYQNCLFAGLDKANKYWPIGHVIKDGKYYQKYYKELPWSAFIIPFEGRPYVGQIQGTDYKLAFMSTPGIKKDGKVFINSKAENTAPDILRSTKRSAIGVLPDGTIRLYTTHDNITLQQLAERMSDCVDILNLDGGGSVSPTNGWERPTSSALIVRKGVPMTIKYFETYDRLTSPFGERVHPITGKKHFHSGIDLVKEDKGPVFATVPGEVIFAQFAPTGSGLGGFGNTVCVLDKNGHVHIYAHLDSIRAALKQKVDKGTLLGTQGNTGQSAGSHLHYEVRSKSTPSFGWRSHVNPTQYLDKYWAEVEAEEAAKKKDWRQEGLEFLQKNYGISADWKATDPVDMGTLGIILSRRK